MSLGLLVGTVLAMLAVMAGVLMGLTYLLARRGRSAPPLPFYAGGVALVLVTAALVAWFGPDHHAAATAFCGRHEGMNLSLLIELAISRHYDTSS